MLLALCLLLFIFGLLFLTIGITGVQYSREEGYSFFDSKVDRLQNALVMYCKRLICVGAVFTIVGIITFIIYIRHT